MKVLTKAHLKLKSALKSSKKDSRKTISEKSMSNVNGTSNGTDSPPPAVEARMVIIEGEIGCGKSRLLHEFKQTLAEEKVVVLTGSSEQIKTTTPYHVWQEIFEPILNNGQLPADNTVDLKPEFLPLVNAVFPSKMILIV
jgi:predicted ATPase